MVRAAGVPVGKTAYPITTSFGVLVEPPARSTGECEQERITLYTNAENSSEYLIDQIPLSLPKNQVFDSWGKTAY